MRIGIDARFLTHPQNGGFKTYTENLVAALAEIDTENEYILYLDRPPQQQVPCHCNSEPCELCWVRNLATTPRDCWVRKPLDEMTSQQRSDSPRYHNRIALTMYPNVSMKVVPGLLPVLGMPWREQVALVRQAAADRLDLFHSPCLTAPLFLPCRLVVTIHDTIWLFPDKFSKCNSRSVQRKMMEWYYRLVPQFAANRASVIITVSQAAKQSIVDNLKLGPNRILVTHEAPSQCFRRINDAQPLESMRRKYNLNLDFILGIGSADPRKNIKTLVQAYAQLPTELQKENLLAIDWTHSFLSDELTKQIEAFGLKNRVRFLQNVSNEDLVLIYNAASLFVLPSLYEGFGLPLLEAMACGTPVVAADNSSIPEIVGDAALLFDAEDAGAMASRMKQVLTDESLRTTLSERGTERVRSFSWSHCARQTIAAYGKALIKTFPTGEKVSAHSP